MPEFQATLSELSQSVGAGSSGEQEAEEWGSQSQ